LRRNNGGGDGSVIFPGEEKYLKVFWERLCNLELEYYLSKIAILNNSRFFLNKLPYSQKDKPI